MERRPFEVPEYSIMLLTIRLPNGVAPKNTRALLNILEPQMVFFPLGSLI